MLDAPNAQNKSSEKKFYASNFHNRYAGKYVSVFQKNYSNHIYVFYDLLMKCFKVFLQRLCYSE